MKLSSVEKKLSKKSSYRLEIDGLRAFAVVTVIINHFNKDILPGGYLGVDIFFVISGYVITSSLFKRPNNDFKDFISGFYERRIKRILPALITNILVVSLLICFFNLTPLRDLKTAALSLFGISNIYLAFLSTDYFGPAASLNAFTQTWSLGVEEQFYFLYPLIAWFAGFAKGGKTKNFAFCLSLLGILSLAAFLGNTEGYGAYYLLNFRFWEITVGCLTFLFCMRANINQYAKKILPVLSFSFIILAMFLPVEQAKGVTLAVVILVAILLSTISNSSYIYKLFTSKVSTYIGLRSYSLYLWHWSIIVLSRFTFGIHWWTIPFQIILILAVSHISYSSIELPFRNFKINRIRVLLIGVLSAVSLSSIIWFIIGKQHNNFYLGKPFSALSNAQPSKDELRLISSTGVQNFFFIGDCYAGAAWWYSKDKLLESGYNIFVNPRNEGLTPAAGFTDADFHLSYTKIQLNNFKDKIQENDFLGFAVNSSNKLMPSTKKALKLVLDEAKNKNAKIIIFGQYPSYPTVDYVLCTTSWYRPRISLNESCNGLQSRELAIKTTIAANDYYEKIARNHKNVYFYNQLRGLCPTKEHCLTKKAGEFLYSDGSHVTNEGAQLIGSGFSNFFNDIRNNNL